MYSAAPSNANIPPIGHHRTQQASRADVGLAIEDLSIEAGSELNGNGQGYQEEYDGVLDDMREPFGHDVEHACR
jgi:hypothetical protein